MLLLLCKLGSQVQHEYVFYPLTLEPWLFSVFEKLSTVFCLLSNPSPYMII